MDLNKLYNEIMTTFNVVVALGLAGQEHDYNDQTKAILQNIILLYILGYTNISIINRNSSLNKTEDISRFVDSIKNIIDKRYIKQVFDKETLETILLDFDKRLKYANNHGLTIEVRNTLLEPVIESIKYI
nr:MAG TPA: hypothetical protein [Caudoviricetes sp.]